MFRVPNTPFTVWSERERIKKKNPQKKKKKIEVKNPAVLMKTELNLRRQEI